MLSSAIVTTSYLQPFWIASAIFHIVGILLCGGGFIIRYRRNTFEPEYLFGIIGIVVSSGRLLWISIQLPASTQLDEEFKWAWMSIMIYTVSLELVKGSIVALYFRVHNYRNLILRFVAGAILLYTLGVVTVIAIIMGGRGPVEANVFVVVHTVLQVIINTTLACLPGKTIRKLKIPRKQKTPMILILIVVFLSGIATIVGGIFRLAALTGIESSLNWARVELAAKAGPGERTAGHSSLELGKVKSKEEAHDTLTEQISAT
ncbi:hypothetical protein V502_00499 [Pseudogymnoascus sp. VKM F-4520 (FW-2644)]|nr:hypothetical protein V502_00499 [Pseudogymnoascus sp. VKM F-4520 (FW-2644)]